MRLFPGAAAERMREIFALTDDALVNNYVNLDAGWMPRQTIDSRGRPAAVIPGMPDADPGYHSGLSLLDVLSVLTARAVTDR